jgi:hypothetical protein
MKLYLPEKCRKEALCEAHNRFLLENNATLKKDLNISSSYFWPRLYQDIEKHKTPCLCCQQRKFLPQKPTPLELLPIPQRSNLRIHADLFDPMITAKNMNMFVLCIRDTLPNMPYSQQYHIKRLKHLQQQFLKNHFAFSESLIRFTQMVRENLLTNCQPKYKNLSTSSTLKLLLHCSAMCN